jgi:hypothetical protein
MPDGGKITIETANTFLDEAYVAQFGDVPQGQYVLLSVTDTGSGIPPDMIAHAFEPFFTTKETGKGTGLGLAMVHGFVKQSGGHIRIYSEEGHGTTVKIYLPRLRQAEAIPAVPAAAEPAPVGEVRARDGETILLVEDNDGVRAFAKATVEELSRDRSRQCQGRSRIICQGRSDRSAVHRRGPARRHERARACRHRAAPAAVPPGAVHHGLHAQRHRAPRAPRPEREPAQQAVHAAGLGTQDQVDAGCGLAGERGCNLPALRKH